MYPPQTPAFPAAEPQPLSSQGMPDPRLIHPSPSLAGPSPSSLVGNPPLPPLVPQVGYNQPVSPPVPNSANNNAVHTRRKSVFFTNSFSVAGRICEKGLQIYNQKVARFTVVQNGPEGSGREPLFTECVMFSPKGGPLPFELLVKGTAVVVSGFRRACSWTDKTGAKHYRVDHVVTEMQAITASYGRQV